MLPVVAAIDLNRPKIQSTCSAGTAGIHFSFNTISIKSGAIIKIPSVAGIDSIDTILNVFKYARPSASLLSCNLE